MSTTSELAAHVRAELTKAISDAGAPETNHPENSIARAA